MSYNIDRVLTQMEEHLEKGIIAFWTRNGIDTRFGGYLTSFGSNGEVVEDTEKYIVTQARMLWGFSELYKVYPEKKELLDMAEEGYRFIINNFWDCEYEGFFWKTNQQGDVLDDGKVVYGQSFAIYALANYYLVSNQEEALSYAERGFELLQIYCTDTVNGGYFENLERDWTISAPGVAAGDRKSLDIHMHLLEAFTVLLEASNKQIHKRKLKESIDIILEKMIDEESGCGRNQFDIRFNPIPAINIKRTWNEEREVSEVLEESLDTTSYGHNIELAWLLNRASKTLGINQNIYNSITKKLVDHAIQYGLDQEYGGIYRDGPHQGGALIYDKEWWQQGESMVGFLDAYETLGEEKYLEAFVSTWGFVKTYVINDEIGEWRQLLTRDGSVIVGSIGNPWKAFYHSGRSIIECIKRVKIISSKDN